MRYIVVYRGLGRARLVRGLRGVSHVVGVGVYRLRRSLRAYGWYSDINFNVYEEEVQEEVRGDLSGS